MCISKTRCGTCFVDEGYIGPLTITTLCVVIQGWCKLSVNLCASLGNRSSCRLKKHESREALLYTYHPTPTPPREYSIAEQYEAVLMQESKGKLSCFPCHLWYFFFIRVEQNNILENQSHAGQEDDKVCWGEKRQSTSNGNSNLQYRRWNMAVRRKKMKEERL